MRRRGAGEGGGGGGMGGGGCARGGAGAAPALALACGLLLVCTHAAAGEPLNGICQSIDVRSFPRELHKLRGCRVIEGSLSMVILERATYQDFANLTFPELREVTGFIMIYRMRGMRNLGDLFPNLSVVRGMQLFKDFAIVIFDCEGFEMLGLRSLTTIEHGAVRIQNNDRLCYTNTIDWSRIIQDGASVNKIRSNYDARLCGLCPNAQSRMKDYRQNDQCHADSQGRLLCWDDKHCQKVCPTCGDNACMDDGKTCCHRECLGGCDGPGVKHCHVCRHFSFGYGENRTCTKACPAGFVELYRRCVSESECRAMTPPPGMGRAEGNQPRIIAYKIFNNTQCVWTCPSGYEERGDAETGRCEPCPPTGCHRECPGGTIDSGSSSEKFKGCTVINGDLNISIRATGSNTMAVLESALGEIRVINGGLKVTRSSPLVSLMFLKNVERINAGDKVALYIFGNQNLELLWDWDNHKRIDITGRLYIHFNAKLCYRVIADLKNFTHTEFTEMEVSPENNGYQAPCFTKKLNMSVQVLHKNLAIFKWDMYCTEDSRKLLGYSLYYIATEHNVTLYGQRDACSETWNVKDITMDEVLSKNNSQNKVSSNKIQDPRIYKDPCENVQPVFYALNGLTPFTTYAAYVKTYTTLQDKKGAQSDIIYFKTLPGRPSPPQSLTAESRDPQSVFIRWSAPALPNGTIIMYHVEIQANVYNKDTIVASNTNFCTNPNKLATLISIPGEDRRADSAGSGAGAGAEAGGDNGTCACSKADKPATKFNSLAEEERRESIQFENELQNYVYIKQNRSKSPNRTKALTRHRRSVEAASLLSTLVILSGNTGPELGRHYANSTDYGGYVKSQYYELDGKTLSLTVDNMRHFTWYTVNVWACRERQPEESDEAYNKTWCSKRTEHIFRTMEMPSADVVRSVRASIIAVNKTLPSVNVTWAPPLRPNGFVVAYNVHYSREPHTAQGQDVSIHNCVAASKCKNDTCGTILPNLVPGNYSVRVTPVTVSGAGNESAAVYVFIEERPSGHEWIWGVISGCLVVVLVIGAGIWYAKRELLQPSEAAKLFASVNPEYVSAVYVPDEWEVPRTSIEFLKELGQGSFGMVYEGIAKNIEKGKPETRCAVKTVNEHATDRERIEFLNEASVMKAFDTFHVVRLLGVVSRGQPTLVVMELMELGDLKSYLRSHRPDADNSIPNKDGSNTPPTLQNILQMAIEIADGMAYLSAKKFVHRDLAARNCMVAGDLTVKVGDFGMTRDIYETDYYRKGTKGLLPVRWMSPESLKDGVFSSNSDAWSYGVVLWEMATLAMQPYQGLSNEQVVRYVVEGGVMERPEHCPDRLYELMRVCWAHRPGQRPSFLHLVSQLAPHAAPHFRTRSFFHSPQGQELYKLQRALNPEEEAESEVNVGAVATGSGSNLFGVSGRLASGRLASWVRELSSLRSRGSDDAAAEPLQPAATAAPPATNNAQPRAIPLKSGPNGVIRGDGGAESTGC